MYKSLGELPFDDSFVREVPGDPETRNFRRQVHGAAYSRVEPEVVRAPTLVAYSAEMLEALGLSEEAVQQEEFAEVMAGNQLLEGMKSYAGCYGGHQFGNWAGQLGDGRAITLGEVIGKDQQRWELQLKGAGPTPYSRRADGRAVLRSSIREFLCSEAMHHLGVPTTRALSLVKTGEMVLRDMFYDGNPADEPGAVVCRVAPSFLRFGSYQLPASRQNPEMVKALLDYTLKYHYPHLGAPSKRSYGRFFEEVCSRTADMIVEWMRVGFVHGVMNTDNMSVLGLTIDYGPYGWLEGYDPEWTPNTTDAMNHRYAYGKQPGIGLWNLAQFGDALGTVMDGEEAFLQAGLEVYQDRFEARWSKMMMEKLGISEFQGESDAKLLKGLNLILQRTETDMTIFFRNLADLPIHQEEVEIAELGGEELLSPLMEAYYRPEELKGHQEEILGWLTDYAIRVWREPKGPEERQELIRSRNPRYVLRNYLAQLAIEKSEAGDDSMVMELLEVLRRPYQEQPGKEEFAGKRPEWARHKSGCSTLSCSS